MSGRETASHGGIGEGLGSTADVVTTGTGHADEEQHHPSNRTYVEIAIFLTIVTVIEVAAWYVEGIRDFLVPLLIVLSTAKFVTVVGYYMHLKFDDRRFLTLFGAGLSISIAVVAALVIMFWTGQYFPEIAISGS